MRYRDDTDSDESVARSTRGAQGEAWPSRSQVVWQADALANSTDPDRINQIVERSEITENRWEADHHHPGPYRVDRQV